MSARLATALPLAPTAGKHLARPGTAVLRGRIALVLAVALLPVVVLGMLWADSGRRAALAWAETEIGAVARMAAEREGRALAQAVHVLRALDGPAEAACARAAALLPAGGAVAAVVARYQDGREACRQGLSDTPSSGLGHVSAALSAGGGVVLVPDPQAGLLAARALPGTPAAVVALLLALPAPPGPPAWRNHLRALLVDPDDGTVLAAVPALPGAVGGHVQAPRLLAAIRNAPGGGVLVARDGQGEEQVAGFAPVPGVEGMAGRAVMVAALPRALLVAEADSRRAGIVAMVLVVSVAAWAAAWHLAERMVVRPVAASARRDVAAAPPGTAWLRHQADLAVAVDFSGEMVLRLDGEMRVTFASAGTRAVLGYAPTEVLGAHLGGEPDWDACRAVLHGLREGGVDQSCRFATRRKDDGEVWLEVRAARLADGGFVLACRDIGAEQSLAGQLAEARARLAELAREDVETGLANRRRFDEALAQEVRRARRVQEPLAVVLLRLAVPTEDAATAPTVLEGVARVLSGALRRPGDLAARFEADVFALLLPTTDRIGAQRMAARLAEALAQAGPGVGGAVVGIGATSVLPLDEGQGPGEVLDLARAALAGALVGDKAATPGRREVASRTEHAA